MTESPEVIVETVPEIGTFTFAKRNMRSEFACRAEYARLSEGAPVDQFTRLFMEAVADLKVLTVDAPKGWRSTELDDMDPFDDATYGRVLKVWSALRGKEETFRRGRAPVPTDGEGAGGNL